MQYEVSQMQGKVLSMLSPWSEQLLCFHFISLNIEDAHIVRGW
jgi:hypothetical protein